MKKILFSDSTLNEAQNGRAQRLLFREKVAVARAIAGLGVDAVKLPKMTNVREDTIINKTIAGVLSGVTVVLPVEGGKERIETSWKSISEAADPCLEIALPVSTVQMEYTFRQKNAGMLEMIAQNCACAHALCPKVAFTALDAMRAEPQFLTEACETAVKNGATVITLCDGTGSALPEEWKKTVSALKNALDVTLFVRLNDRLGFAATCLLAVLEAGADGVETCLRSDECFVTEKAAAVLAEKGEERGFETSLSTTKLHTDIEKLIKSMRQISYAEDTSAVGRTVVLDADSSVAQIKEAAMSLGYDLDERDIAKVKESLETICRKKRTVGQKEFEAIIASNAMQVPSTYHLDSYTATSSNLSLAVSQVTLIRKGEKISGVASGDGPIDAAFRALESCIGYHYELDDFEIQSVTEGREALGSALVRLRHGGKLYSGNGLSTDIVGASIRAYINALNKIVYEE